MQGSGVVQGSERSPITVVVRHRSPGEPGKAVLLLGSSPCVSQICLYGHVCSLGWKALVSTLNRK